MAYVLQIVVFFGFLGVGLWGLAGLTDPWGWVAFIAAFGLGGVSSRLVFKRFATPEQVTADLEARLYND